MAAARILVVDDEQAIVDMICNALEMAGFDCESANNTQAAYAAIVDNKPDALLLDWMMPGGSGLELARRLRRDVATRDLPLIMLTAKADEDNRVQGLEAGADDYIAKPFSPRELVARVQALLRRTKTDNGAPIVAGQLQLDRAAQRLSIDGRALELSPTEYRMLEFFMTHQDRVYTRAQLLDCVWGNNVYIDERTIDVHIRRLRKNIEAAGGDGQWIQTVRGSGYRFSTVM